MSHKVSPELHRAEKRLTERVKPKGLYVVFGGPEDSRRWLVKDRADDAILGHCYPQGGYGFIGERRFEFSSIAGAIREFVACRPSAEPKG